MTDNAADIAFFLIVYSAARVFMRYLERPRDIFRELRRIAIGLLFASVCFVAAYNVHARHAGYYLLLGWAISEMFEPKIGRWMYVAAATFFAWGIAYIAMLGDHFWIMILAWFAGIIVAGFALSTVIKPQFSELVSKRTGD